MDYLRNNLQLDRQMTAADIDSLFMRPAYLWSHPAVRKKSKPPDKVIEELSNVKEWLLAMARQAGDLSAGRVSEEKVMQVYNSITAVVNRGELTGKEVGGAACCIL